MWPRINISLISCVFLARNSNLFFIVFQITASDHFTYPVRPLIVPLDDTRIYFYLLINTSSCLPPPISKKVERGVKHSQVTKEIRVCNPSFTMSDWRYFICNSTLATSFDTPLVLAGNVINSVVYIEHFLTRVGI